MNNTITLTKPRSSMNLSKSQLLVWIGSPIVALLWLFGLTWLAYYESLDVVFHFDDIPFIQENQSVRNLGQLIQEMIHPFNSGRAIPLLTFHLNYVLHEFEVQGYHFVNICIHGINGFLVYLLVLRALAVTYTSSSNWRSDKERSSLIQLTAYSVATLFVVHPLLTASVTYITQRSGQLATTFYVLAFWSYLQARLYAEKQTWKKAIIWGLLTVFCYWLAYKSKSMALTWLLIPVFYEIATRVKDPKRLRPFLKVGVAMLGVFVLLVIGYFSRTHYLSGNYFVGFNSETLWGPFEHWQAMSRAMVEYMKFMVLPLPQWLNIDHDFTISHHTIDWVAMLAFFGHISLLGFGLFIAKKGHPLIVMGIGWIYISMGPYIIVPERDLLVEYKAYLPTVGWMLILADLLFWLYQKPKLLRPLAAVIVVCLVLGFFGTKQRNAAYATTASVWKDAISKAPYKARTLHNLGFAYADEGHYSAARVYFQKSLQMSPGFVLARLNLARVFARLNEREEALKEYGILIQLSASFPVGELRGMVLDSHFESAQVYITQRDFQKALHHLNILVNDYGSQNVKVYLALGKVYLEMQDYANAKQYYEGVAQYFPEDPGIMRDLGVISIKEQKPAEAIQYLLKSVKNEQNPAAYNNLGIAHLMLGNPLAASQSFQRALQIAPGYEEATKNLLLLKQMESKQQQ